MAPIATTQPTVKRDGIVERGETVEHDRILDRYEAVEDDALDEERQESFGSRSPVRGMMIAAPVGAGLWALLISLVRLALS